MVVINAAIAMLHRRRPYYPAPLAVVAQLLLLASPSLACASVNVGSASPAKNPAHGGVDLVGRLASDHHGAEGLSGVAIMAAVNAVAAEKKDGDDVVLSNCETGFIDQEAILTAACPSGGDEQTVDWGAYDEAYAAAPVALPTAYLEPPKGCTYGCVPLIKKSNATASERVAAALPWRGKCFTPAAAGETVVPTLGDGTAATEPVPLLARIVNRISEVNVPVGGEGRLAQQNAKKTVEERLAPATVYVGEAAFDGQPALIIDYTGMDNFNTFRDEIRHVGCGVWLGKTYLTGPPDTLPRSLATMAGVGGGITVNPFLATMIVKAMPDVTPDAPLPLVLNFVIFQTTPEAQALSSSSSSSVKNDMV